MHVQTACDDSVPALTNTPLSAIYIHIDWAQSTNYIYLYIYISIYIYFVILQADQFSCAILVFTMLLIQLLPQNYVDRKGVLVIGWIIFFVLAYKVSMIQLDYVEYDPFLELEIDRVSKLKQIFLAALDSGLK